MVPQNTEKQNTAYTITIDAAHPSMTTGISAQDRATTARALADPHATEESFRRPGHVLPLRAKAGGVRERFGHTEAAVELCRLAGKEQAALICEMVRDGVEVEGVPEREDGGMMRRDDCLEFGRRWGLKVCTIEDIVDYVEAKEGKLAAPGKNY
jgi:3,4-dihydroxy 2-butanone 4-phosphate synthase